MSIPDKDNKNEVHFIAIKKWSEEHLLSNLLIMNIENNLYSKMRADLCNSCLQVVDNCPTTTTRVLKLLQNCVDSHRGTIKGVSILHKQTEVPIKGRDSKIYPNIKCYKCSLFGYKAK